MKSMYLFFGLRAALYLRHSPHHFCQIDSFQDGKILEQVEHMHLYQNIHYLYCNITHTMCTMSTILGLCYAMLYYNMFTFLLYRSLLVCHMTWSLLNNSTLYYGAQLSNVHGLCYVILCLQSHCIHHY